MYLCVAHLNQFQHFPPLRFLPPRHDHRIGARIIYNQLNDKFSQNSNGIFWSLATSAGKAGATGISVTLPPF